MDRVRFRYNVSICLAGVLGFLGAIPVATVGFGHGAVHAYAYFLLLILLIPLAVAVWGARAGTDADADGLRVRAALASRRIGWTEVAALAPAGRRVYVRTTDGRSIRLAAVSHNDLPRLVAASGQRISRATVAPDPISAVGAPSGRHRAADPETEPPVREPDAEPVRDQ
ncbi:MAG TPA: PH domain-containing protein [Micromonosporaceae bacterium]|nr:PH domain-containing protein [Micromonosporaceae bacterium]